MKEKLYQFDNKGPLELSLFSSLVKAGFPSSADDSIDESLDLNEYLIEHAAATFFVRVDGRSMEGGGIKNGDLLVVDRSVEARSGKIVVAILNGEFTVKRLEKKGSEIYLVAENAEYAPIQISPDDDFAIWGVVTYIIHKCTS